jgi:heme o synthase
VTGAAGFFLASSHSVKWLLLVETLGGMSLVIASACVFNNYIDRGIDAKMERTKTRAIAAGKVGPIAAITYASLLGITGFAILGLFTNWLVFAVGLISIIFYVIIYGWAKRDSVYSTLVGSIPGAAPPVAGYLAVTNHVDSAAALLFLVLVCWQMPHFYAISMYRYKDYKRAGLPVLAVKKGMAAARRQIVGYIIAFTVTAALIGGLGYAGDIYIGVVIGLGVWWLYKAARGWKLTDEKWGRQLFFASLIVNLGWSVITALGSRLP